MFMVPAVPEGDARARATATPDNALSLVARDALLRRRLDGRLATHRPDGWCHVTPIWFTWDGARFRFTLGESRLHLRNLATNDRATFSVGVDHELDGTRGGTAYVTCFGRAVVTTAKDDETLVRDTTYAVLGRYWPELDERVVFAEPRSIVTLYPVRWLTWQTAPTGESSA